MNFRLLFTVSFTSWHYLNSFQTVFLSDSHSVYSFTISSRHKSEKKRFGGYEIEFALVELIVFRYIGNMFSECLRMFTAIESNYSVAMSFEQ